MGAEDTRKGFWEWFHAGPGEIAAKSNVRSPSTHPRPTTADQAEAEARAYLETENFSEGMHEALITDLSPEGRMLVVRSLAGFDLLTDRMDRVRFEVGQLLREGKATVGEMAANFASMSPQGRAYARHIITSHPEWRVKGRRWHPGPYSEDEMAAPGNPHGYTSYQLTMDLVMKQPEWDEAASLVEKSKRHAGNEHWADAAAAIGEAIHILDLQETWYPEPLLAVALFHQEAYLGQQGDATGARTAIERAMRIFRELTDADRDYAPDLADAWQSFAYCLVDQGNLEAGLTGAQAASDILQTYLADTGAPLRMSLAEYQITQAQIQSRLGDLGSARESINKAASNFELASVREQTERPGLVEYMRVSIPQMQARYQ